MNVLFISNFYPPLELGGWEQLTQELAQRLTNRGHATAVLTSRHRANEISAPEPGVYRLLHLESDDILHYHPASWLTKGRRERENLRYLDAVIGEFRPDIVFFHSMWGLPRSLAWRAEQMMPGRVIYYIAGDWPHTPNAHESYWQSPARRLWLRWPKRIAAAIPLALLRRQRQKQVLKFEHVLCVSQAVREDLARHAAIPLERSRVIYNGIDTDQFAPPPDCNPTVWKNGTPSFLYAGSLIRTKGVHTAIEGFARATRWPELAGASLTVVGSGDPAYEAHLRQLAHDGGVANRVHFFGRVERSQMPDLLRRFDCLVFPSSYEEPLARMMQEAMACGLVVVGTTTGGSKELLIEGETGLAFQAEDADGLARQIRRLVVDPELRCRLAQAGRQAVVERFGLERMVDEVEAYLARVISEARFTV